MNIENSPSSTFTALLDKALRCSRYAKRVLETDQVLLDWLRENHSTPCDRSEIKALLLQSGLDLADEAELTRTVRKLRKQVMVKLILRDLNGLADLNEVMQAMTALAEECVQLAQACLMEALRVQFGAPIGEASGKLQELLVIGMGKLGGGELNVSSDIDLIFVYPEDGETDGARSPRKEDAAGYPTAAPLPSRRLSNHEFFTRMGRRLINLISELTADGYVFRVDMRLRPYGDSGPLVMSFAALEEYLLSQGREWERYAWIKARVVAPADSPQIAELTQLVQPFVFRKYLDYGAIDS
ncbi:MAG: bifunctional glutamine synthetase adenylyltransferase/deadenyltransferase, partial [Gallionella sp.]